MYFGWKMMTNLQIEENIAQGMLKMELAHFRENEWQTSLQNTIIYI